jgi:ribosomal protein L19
MGTFGRRVAEATDNERYQYFKASCFKNRRRGESMTRNQRLYYQKIVVVALEKEFGFAPARLNEIVLLEADDIGFYIHFRIRKHYYTCRYEKIEQTDDKGSAL